MITFLKTLVNGFLRIFNLQLSFYKKPIKRYSRIINNFNIDIVFDVGANDGEFGSIVLDEGFKGTMISFEPVSIAHEKLKLKAKNYKNWIVHQRVALGNETGTTTINIAGNNAASSSILEMGSTHIKSAPYSQYISSEEVNIIKLDSIFNDYVAPGNEVMVKIDVQGYEEHVLLGASNILNKVRVIKLECSLKSLYDGDKTYDFYFDWLIDKGYRLFDVDPGHIDGNTGQLLQFDAIFVKD